MMQRVEDSNACSSRGVEDVQHVRDARVGLSDTLQAIPYLSTVGNKVVVRIDNHKACDVLLIRHIGHAFLRY
jgi:hypothetical protein